MWEESRSPVISLWTCFGTKRRLIVLKEIPLGTITLCEIRCRLSPNALTRLIVWRYLEHGSAANLTSTSGGHVHSTSSGTTAIKAAILIDTTAAIAFGCSAWVSSSRWAQSSAEHSTWAAPLSFLQLLLTFSHPWCFIVSLGGPRSHQAQGSHCKLLAEWRYMPDHVHCGVHVVLPKEFACYRFLRLGTITCRHCAIAHAFVYQVAHLSA